MVETNDLPFFLPKKAPQMPNMIQPEGEPVSVIVEDDTTKAELRLAPQRDLKIKDLIEQSLDKGVLAIIDELNELQSAIDALREKVQNDVATVKEVLGSHFNVQAEARDSARSIRNRLVYLSNGGAREEASPAAAAGVRPDGQDQGGGMGGVDGA